MKRDRFLSEYHRTILEDWGCVVSDDFKSFARKFKNYLKRQLAPYNINIAAYHVGHYDISGFVEKNEKYIYFSYNIPRGCSINVNASDARYGVLFRTANDTKDFRGGQNYFTSIENAATDIATLFDWEAA